MATRADAGADAHDAGRRSAADRRQPPGLDEAEVSLFGPGIGECVVMHLGGGDWVVVDSCVDAGRRAIALRYLADLGIDAAQAVRLVVVSHWHDDHIRGIASVVDAAPDAEVVCSAALNTKDFFTLVAASNRAMTEWPGTAEFARIFEILERRVTGEVSHHSIGPRWAGADQRVWWRQRGATTDAEIWALSPSSGSMTLAFRGLAELLPRPGTPKRRLVTLTPNESAVVLWVVVGGVRLLLGSDLEVSENPKTGWKAIVQSATRPSGSAHVFKVPHHGAASADEPRVWGSMLTSSPEAVLTPFNRGRYLPMESDVTRLRARSAHVYCTARPGGWNPPRRDAAVERTLREIVRDRKAVTGPMGHVRIRVDVRAPQAPRVELFDGAYQL